MKNEIKYIQPHDQEIEKAILGAVILEGASLFMENIITQLREEIFYDLKNQLVFKAINNLFVKRQKIDLLTVSNYLSKIDKLKDCGGVYYLTELTSKVNSSANIEAHVHILKEFFIKRNIIQDCTEILRESYSDTSDAFDLVSKLNEIATKIDTEVATAKTITNADLSVEAIKTNQILKERKDDISGIKSGFKDLDKLTGGWHNSDLIITAARPGMGKTSLMLEYVVNANVPTLVFSLEMSAKQLYSRILSQKGNIPLNFITKTGVYGNLEDAFLDVNEKIGQMPIYYEDGGGLDITFIRNKARKIKREHDIQLIVIDYLQLIRDKSQNNRNKENEISSISMNLKAMAKELNLPVICLSQLSRECEKRANKVPVLSDLRDSGSIEQDADMVQFIYRPDYYGITNDEDGNDTTGLAQIRIAKHRNGAIDNVLLRFEPERTAFYDFERTDTF